VADDGEGVLDRRGETCGFAAITAEGREFTGPGGRSGHCRAVSAGAVGTQRWLTHRMVAPIPEPDPSIDPTEPVPDDPGELLPDAPEPLPPPPIEPTPDDPGGDPGGVPEPA
jgi:hypothetical protein